MIILRILKQRAQYGLNEVEKELPGRSSSSFVQGLLCDAEVLGVLHKTSTDIFPGSIFIASS